MKLHNIKPIKWITSFSIAGIVALASCTDEALLQEGIAQEGEPGTISFRCADMLDVYRGPDNYATRAGGPKKEEEKRINTLHVFFFSNNSEGKLLTTKFDNFHAYQKLTGKSILKIPKLAEGETLFKEGSDNIRIVVIANIDATDEASDSYDEANTFKTVDTPYGRIQKSGRDAGGKPYEITCYDSLLNWVYYPRIRMAEGAGDITQLPAAGMPMIGDYNNEGNGVDLSSKPDEGLILNLTALMAKVNISVRLDPRQYTSNYPQLKIREYGIKNMPIAVPFSKPTGNRTSDVEGSADKPESYAQYLKSYDVTDAPMYHSKGTPSTDPEDYSCSPDEHEFTTTKGLPIIINRDSKAQLFSYYTYENINVPNYSAVKDNEDEDGNKAYYPGNITPGVKPDYPDGVKEEDRQRWKPKIAYDNRASALILKGEYTTDQEVKYEAQFTIYMGGNSEDDFQVKRNHCYDNNIVIQGLDYIRNSTDNVFTFDGRVNVKSDNPLYLAIINERMVDAHATALPMDVWFMLRENEEPENVDWTSEVTFTIENRENVNWIRMEKIPRWTRNGVTGMEDSGWKLGNGARSYFTTDLVTNTLKENGTADGKEHGWKITVRGGNRDSGADGSRSRIYFYIDENVPPRNDVLEDEYGPRTATIKVNYNRKNKAGEVIDHQEYTLNIDQKALLKVSGTWKGNDNGTADIPVTWMEYYEEYLEHNDPLDKHESPGELYSGLPWGLDGKNVYYSLFTTSGFNNPERGNDSYQVYYKTGAFPMTQWAINQLGSESLNKVMLFNTEAPASAFHYCYGKNKRNANGTAAISGSKGWYMPGIRELEKALVDYYDIFPDFRGNLYWSASGTDNNRWSDGKNARATKVTFIGGRYTYANSRSSGDVGFNPRSQSNRIRAFYRVD